MTLPPSLSALLKHLPSLKGDGTPHPARDWLVLLAFFFVLLVTSIVWNVWFFTSALSGEGTAAPLTEGEGAPSDSVERANAVFDARALEEARYRSEYRFVDPSR